jgi:hypothetical protein
MGYNARKDEIRDNVTRMRREWEAQRGALATVRRFNAIMSSKGHAWFWPTIAAALVSKHHWLVINCDSCGTVDLDDDGPLACSVPMVRPYRAARHNEPCRRRAFVPDACTVQFQRHLFILVSFSRGL